MNYKIPKILWWVLAIFIALSFLFPYHAQAYSLTKERPVFLAWPLPSYIGVARISQFPNTPWTWNFLGLNAATQCPPAFGYLEIALPTWRDPTIAWEQDSAQADPHQFQMVECYSTSGEAGTNGHEGTDIKAPVGTPAYASADGKVAGWRLNDLNSMIVLKHCLGGSWDAGGECVNGVKWYTTYMHIVVDPAMQVMNLDVKAHTPLGTVFNQGDNSHLHFEVGLDKRNYANYVNPWGRDEAPWIGCMWMDQSICVMPNPGYERYALLNSNRRWFVKQDDIGFVELYGADGVENMQLRGRRIGFIDSKGYFMVGDREYPSATFGLHDFVFNWTNLGKGVVHYQLTENRIALLDATGLFKVKEGDLSSNWGLQIEGVQSFSISDHRIGVLSADGILRILEGGFTGDRVTFQGVKAFQLTDTRLAIVDSNGMFMVKEGPLDFEWKEMGKNIRAFQLSGTRVGIINDQNQLLVNDGNLRADWILQAENVQSFQLADNRIVILDANGTWKIKDGSLFQGWADVNTFKIQNVVLSGEIPVIIR